MRVALSPCPNDTFIFYAWIHGLVGKLPITPTFADLVELNPWALDHKFPLIKLSLATYAKVMNDYHFLPVGAALGYGTGPIVVGKSKKLAKVAIPGKGTTAELLFDRFLSGEKIYCHYDEVCDLILDGTCDSGVIIHETRFTFEKMGLTRLFDLGGLWEEQTGLPLPLGGLALSRTSPHKDEVVQTLSDSLSYAKANLDEVIPFMQKHAIEKDLNVIQQHVKTYVTNESEKLSLVGIKALEAILGQPKEIWLYETRFVCTNV